MRYFILIICCLYSLNSSAQDEPKENKFQNIFTVPDTLNKTRFWTLNTTLGVGYTGVVIALDRVWYAQFPRSKFHTFNDMGEWEDMDKMGHLFTAYMESRLSAQMYRWTGVERKKAAYAGVILGTVFQSTLETLDGFSEEWGWSWGDIGFNTAGCLTYLAQELAWKEQRIHLKISSWRRKLHDETITSTDGMHTASLVDRRNYLYGTNYGEILLKDYNSLTIWASLNIHSFIKNENSKFPKWLNIAVGYGAENVYGGFDNIWTDDDTGAEFILEEANYPRYRQIYFSFDVDLTKIKTKNKFVRTLLMGLNIIKIPAPALEINTLGKVKFHPIHF